MFSARNAARVVGVGAFLLLTLQATALAQVSIRVDGVPDRLRFPLPEGANEVLTATIKGGKVKSAWLAIPPSSRRVMLARVDASEYAINLGAAEVFDMLKARGTSGQFRIFAQAVDGTTVRSLAVRYTMHAVPERLDFPFDEAKMTIYQRASKKLPGSEGALRIHVGDITAGQVPVTIYGPRGELVVDTTPMQEGDTLSLPLVEQDYVLRLDRLVNLLVGHDYGVFTLMPLHQLEAQRIDDLFRVIEKADATFIRNDQELSGEAFATHLRGKHEYSGPRNASLTDFIEKVATRSSTTGKRYGVKLPSGDIVDADAWLREQAAKLVREPIEEDDNATEVNEQAPSDSGCSLDTKGFEHFLDEVEESGVTFTCNGSEIMTAAEFTRFLRPYLGSPYATDACFDAFIDIYTASLEACGDAYQAKSPDGRTVASATWLRTQASEAATEVETIKDAPSTGGKRRAKERQ